MNSYDDDEEDPELPDASDLDDDDDFSSEDSASSTMPVWILIGVILCLAVVVGLWLR